MEGPIDSFDQGDLDATIPPYQNLPCNPPKKQNAGMRFRESGTWRILPLTTAVGSILPVQTKRNDHVPDQRIVPRAADSTAAVAADRHAFDPYCSTPGLGALLDTSQTLMSLPPLTIRFPSGLKAMLWTLP